MRRRTGVRGARLRLADRRRAAQPPRARDGSDAALDADLRLPDAARGRGDCAPAGGRAASRPPTRASCSGAIAATASADAGAYLARALEAVGAPPAAAADAAGAAAIRVKTSPWLRSVLPARLAVSRAERRGAKDWEQQRGGARGGACGDGEDRRRHGTRRRARAARARASDRGATSTGRCSGSSRGRRRSIALSAARVARGARGQAAACCSAPATSARSTACSARRRSGGRVTYMTPGPWFFEPPTPDYWGRRLARWRKGMKSRPVPAKGSFRIDPGAARTRRGGVPVLRHAGPARDALPRQTGGARGRQRAARGPRGRARAARARASRRAPRVGRCRRAARSARARRRRSAARARWPRCTSAGSSRTRRRSRTPPRSTGSPAQAASTPAGAASAAGARAPRSRRSRAGRRSSRRGCARRPASAPR